MMQHEHEPGAVPHDYWLIEHGETKRVEGGVIEESTLSIYVNGQELATVMCSPLDQEALALGFLYNEGVIESVSEIGLLQPNVARTTIDILLNRSDFNPPRRMILTSGCGGGITLQDLTATYAPIDSDFKTTPDVILQRMRDLQGAARLYNHVRGVHTATLNTPDQMLVSAEDVGRHNTIDKIVGKALQMEQNTTDCFIMTSGRISSEMAMKARRMKVPLIASRTAPTSTAIRLAETWNICIVGYVRSGGLRVYTHPYRLSI